MHGTRRWLGGRLRESGLNIPTGLNLSARGCRRWRIPWESGIPHHHNSKRVVSARFNPFRVGTWVLALVLRVGRRADQRWAEGWNCVAVWAPRSGQDGPAMGAECVGRRQDANTSRRERDACVTSIFVTWRRGPCGRGGRRGRGERRKNLARPSSVRKAAGGADRAPRARPCRSRPIRGR